MGELWYSHGLVLMSRTHFIPFDENFLFKIQKYIYGYIMDLFRNSHTLCVGYNGKSLCTSPYIVLI